MSQQLSLQDLVVGTLNEMGIPVPSTLMHTFALRKGCLVAEKFHYDQGYAVWAVGNDAVDFYDQDGKLLRTVAIALAQRGEAA